MKYTRVQKIKKHSIPLGIIATFVFIFYRSWFQKQYITSGDWGFFFPEAMLDWVKGWQLWDSGFNFGRILENFFFQFNIHGLLAAVFGWSYAYSERVVWFFPLLILAIISPYPFFYFLTKKRISALFAALFFLFNTYILTVTTGGQISVGVSIMMAPLAMLFVIKALREGKTHQQILAAFLLELQSLYDLRITYITFLLLGLYVIFSLLVTPHDRFKQLLTFTKRSLWGLITFILLQLYWLLPFLQGVGPSLPQGFTDASWVTRLSFMNIGNGLSLFHPLWPLRTLADIHVIEPLFYINVLILITALFFLRKKPSLEVIFMLGLLLGGTFLLKGSQEPSGAWYIWAFNNIPGFVMFRDPSKFYLPIIIGYSFFFGTLIHTLYEKIQNILSVKNIPQLGKRYLAPSFLIITLIFIFSQTHPAIFQETGGTLRKPSDIPLEYQILYKFLRDQEGFFRTFWIPKKYRFGYFDNQHPIISYEEITNTIMPSSTSKRALTSSCNTYNEIFNQQIFRLMAARYIILPFDENGELNHLHGNCSPRITESMIRKRPWIKKINITKGIKIFENKDHLDHIFASNTPLMVENDPSIMNELGSLDRSLWENPTILFSNTLTQSQKRFIQTLPYYSLTKYAATDKNSVLVNEGWNTTNNNMDTSGGFFPDALLTYGITVPTQGQYDLFANIRYDDIRGTLKYVIDAPKISGVVSQGEKKYFKPESLGSRQSVTVEEENNAPPLQDESRKEFKERTKSIVNAIPDWSEGLAPYYDVTTKEKGAYFYQDTFLGKQTLEQGNHTLTFRNSVPYKGVTYGEQQFFKEGKYGAMTLHHFFLLGYPKQEAKKIPDITWERKDAGHYEAHIKNAEGPFWLNFLEQYHPEWEASVEDQNIASAMHFQSNIYAQSWYVERTGNFTVRVSYKPQELFDKGLTITLSVLALNIIILLYVAIQKLVRKRV